MILLIVRIVLLLLSVAFSDKGVYAVRLREDNDGNNEKAPKNRKILIANDDPNAIIENQYIVILSDNPNVQVTNIQEKILSYFISQQDTTNSSKASSYITSKVIFRGENSYESSITTNKFELKNASLFGEYDTDLSIIEILHIYNSSSIFQGFVMSSTYANQQLLQEILEDEDVKFVEQVRIKMK